MCVGSLQTVIWPDGKLADGADASIADNASCTETYSGATKPSDEKPAGSSEPIAVAYDILLAETQGFAWGTYSWPPPSAGESSVSNGWEAADRAHLETLISHGLLC